MPKPWIFKRLVGIGAASVGIALFASVAALAGGGGKAQLKFTAADQAAAQAVAVGASAARTALPRCGPNDKFSEAQRRQASTTVRTLFPSAKTAGFRLRLYHGREGERGGHQPGLCGTWWADYGDRERIGTLGGLQIGPPYVELAITLFRTPALALAALAAYGSPKVLANGANVWVTPDGGDINSVIRNVAIRTSSSYPYDANGVPDYSRGPAFPLSTLMKIDRQIWAAVLESR